MNIAIATNRKYVPISYVMLHSLFSNNKDEHINQYILHSELIENDLTAFFELAERFGNTLIPLYVDPNLFPKNLPTTASWSIETYYRLALLALLPPQIDRILYLDVDMIILRPLRELYSMPFEDSHFIACDDPDPFGVNFPDRKELFAEAFATGYRYFNAGMMLWNLDMLRSKYSLESYIQLAESLHFKMSALDQDLLNYMHWGHIKYADTKYNYFARLRSNQGDTYADAMQNAYIIHFLSQKPWDADGYHFDIEKIWWEYARQTPYYQDLLEAFLEKTLTDRTTFLQNSELYQANLALQNSLNESVVLNQKLYAMLQ